MAENRDLLPFVGQLTGLTAGVAFFASILFVFSFAEGASFPIYKFYNASDYIANSMDAILISIFSTIFIMSTVFSIGTSEDSLSKFLHRNRMLKIIKIGSSGLMCIGFSVFLYSLFKGVPFLIFSGILFSLGFFGFMRSFFLVNINFPLTLPVYMFFVVAMAVSAYGYFSGSAARFSEAHNYTVHLGGGDSIKAHEFIALSEYTIVFGYNDPNVKVYKRSMVESLDEIR